MVMGCGLPVSRVCKSPPLTHYGINGVLDAVVNGNGVVGFVLCMVMVLRFTEW